MLKPLLSLSSLSSSSSSFSALPSLPPWPTSRVKRSFVASIRPSRSSIMSTCYDDGHRSRGKKGFGSRNSWPCIKTAGQLQVAVRSVHVFYQSASTAPCCIHLAFPPAQQTKQCTRLDRSLSTGYYCRSSRPYYKLTCRCEMPCGICIRVTRSSTVSPQIVSATNAAYNNSYLVHECHIHIVSY